LVIILCPPFLKSSGFYINEEQHEQPRDYTTLELINLTYVYADKYSVSPETMIRIIECESSWNHTVQSYHYKDGIREESYGLVQIFLPAHPHITKEQAQDPEFALDFLSKNISLGNSWWWTCY